uniref:Uncharacterized protein n=1 Tax=Arundo donax TaxID=35708 RepID=A0A0A9A2P6_ARUDO
MLTLKVFTLVVALKTSVAGSTLILTPRGDCISDR